MKAVKGSKSNIEAVSRHEDLSVVGEDGHRTKIAVRNFVYRAKKPLAEWPKRMQERYWALGVALGCAVPVTEYASGGYPFMVKQTMIDKLSQFYALEGKDWNAPKKGRTSVYDALEELKVYDLIEVVELERFFDPKRTKYTVSTDTSVAEGAAVFKIDPSIANIRSRKIDFD